MSVTIRPATVSDVDTMVDLLVEDAGQRCATDKILWKLDPDPKRKGALAIRSALTAETPPFRQQWLVAEARGDIVGISHSILVPVPPIYAGALGAPGLIMEDCCVAQHAPAETAQSLLEAAERDLIAAGAKIVLASSVAGGLWEAEYATRNYAPLTAYLAKTGLEAMGRFDGVRPATQQDVPGIVASSADNRQVLFDLDAFWKPHPEADLRFGNWMRRSLTLKDRDMFVSEFGRVVEGYAIAQPATPLHFPSPHDITGVGVIDDFYHSDFANPTHLADDAQASLALLHAAETAFKARGTDAALIVCPAAWASKMSLLQKAGYETAIMWYIKK